MPGRTWLHYLVVGLLAVGSAAGGYYLTSRRLPTPPPVVEQLSVDKLSYDFGAVGQGETLSAEFRITNGYAAPVDLRDIRTGCSCQVASVSPPRLGPGEVATLRLDWKTGSRQGPVSDVFWVFHSIPGEEPGVTGRMRLRVTAVVEPDIAVEPEQVDFRRGVAGTRQVRLTAKRVERFAVVDAYSNTQDIVATYRPDASAVEVRYTPAAGPDAGGTEFLVTLITDAPHTPALRIPVRVSRPPEP